MFFLSLAKFDFGRERQMVRDKIRQHGEILDINPVVHENMVTGNFTIEFKTRERSLDVIFLR